MPNKLIFLILFIPSVVFCQSSGTIITSKLSLPTTSQLLRDKCISVAINNAGKITIINLLLNNSAYYRGLVGTDIDVITGQDLTNIKTNIEKDIDNSELGRNYSANITYPIYRKAGK